jgi:hypothetical protein
LKRSRRDSNNQPLEIISERSNETDYEQPYNEETIHWWMNNLENNNELENNNILIEQEYSSDEEIEQIQIPNINNPVVMNSEIVKPTKFFGNGTQDPIDWLKKFDKAARVNGWNENLRREKLYGFLEDQAEDWYLETYVEEDEELPTWTALMTSFKDKFCGAKWQNKWIKQLSELKQLPGETIDQYNSRYTRLIVRVPAGMPDEQKFFYFKKGLKKGILPLISMHNPDDVKAAVELIREYEDAEDIEEGIEPEDDLEQELKKYKKKVNRKTQKKVQYESDSSEDETPVKKNKKKTKEVKEDPMDEITRKMSELSIKLAKIEQPQTRNSYNNNGYQQNRNSIIRCYNCNRTGHIQKDCQMPNRNNNQGFRNNNYNNNYYNNSYRGNNNQPRNNDRFRNNDQQGNNNNQPRDNNQTRRNEQQNFNNNNSNNNNRTHTNYVNIENYDNEEETGDEDTEEIIALWNDNMNIDSFGNQKGIKRPRTTEPEIIYDWKTDKKETKTPVNKPKLVNQKFTNNQKKPITKIIKTSEKLQPEFLQGPEFNLVKELKKLKIEVPLSQLLQMSPKQKSKLLESLRRPKEATVSFTNNENTPKTTTLECQIIVNGFKVPATIDSGAATSIIARNTMEQLGFDIEEATNCKIISANGNKTESLGRIKDFPVKINGNTIPINVEVMETDSYHILLGNDWMMKAGASYNWKNQELTLNWRNQTIKTPASCERKTIVEDSEEEYSDDDEDKEPTLFLGKDNN